MKSLVGIFAFCALMLVIHPGGALGQSLQTDWSGGPGVPGPVPEFGDRFDEGDLAWWTQGGQLALRSMPRSDFPEDVLIVDADRPPRCAVADVTGDGFMDVILSDPIISPFDPNNRRGGIYVWQNDGEGHWTRTVITEEFYGARHVDTVDLDQDGDLDVIASAFYGEIDPPPPPPSERNGRYAWFENLDGNGIAWLKHEIGQLFWGANHIAAGDIDGDDDCDLVGFSTLTDGVYEQAGDVVWFENVDGEGEDWSQHDVSTDFNDAFEGYAVDINGDSKLDIIASGYDRFEWFENLDGTGLSWDRHPISPTITGAGYFDVGDLDGDGDIDFVGSGLNNGVLVSWLNNGNGLFWGTFVIGPVYRGYNAELADIDGDGDLDAVASKEGSISSSQLVWAENLGGGASWELSYVDIVAPSGAWAKPGDVDRDGKPELVASFEDAYDVGVQLSAYTLTDFASSGTLGSSILDGGAGASWGMIAWDASVPQATNLGVEIRGSDDPQNLGAFVTVPASGSDCADLIDPTARYVQYRIILDSGDPDASPILREIGIETGDPTAVDPSTALPVTAVLHSPYPNPFNPTTRLSYELSAMGRVHLAIYDAAGRELRTLVSGVQSAGGHELVWDGRGGNGSRLASGIYYARLETAAGVCWQKLALLK